MIWGYFVFFGWLIYAPFFGVALILTFISAMEQEKKQYGVEQMSLKRTLKKYFCKKKMWFFLAIVCFWQCIKLYETIEALLHGWKNPWHHLINFFGSWHVFTIEVCCILASVILINAVIWIATKKG